MMHHIRHFFASAKHTKQGLIATFKNETAFKQEVVVLLIILPIIFFLEISLFDKILLITSWLLVLAVELLNTAVESAVDRIGLEQHKLSGRAKDQGSAAVAITMLIAALVWLGVLL